MYWYPPMSVMIFSFTIVCICPLTTMFHEFLSDFKAFIGIQKKYPVTVNPPESSQVLQLLREAVPFLQ